MSKYGCVSNLVLVSEDRKYRTLRENLMFYLVYSNSVCDSGSLGV
jgi:hypothetical protein